MRITIENIVPIPLKEKFALRESEIWNRKIEFQPKQWVKIKAPSGTGKTTLMNILYRVRHDYEGKVLYGEKELKSIKPNELAGYRQKHLSVIFQDLQLFANLTARENIELKRVMNKPLHARETIDSMAEELGIASILQQRAGICSYGEQQRIAIIRSLMQPFDWLIMDEPFSHLDKANTQKAARLIASECLKRKAGFILTDLDEDENFPYSHFYDL